MLIIELHIQCQLFARADIKGRVRLLHSLLPVPTPSRPAVLNPLPNGRFRPKFADSCRLFEDSLHTDHFFSAGFLTQKYNFFISRFNFRIHEYQ